MPSIQFDIIPSYQVDNAKWDACINKSSSGLLYATSDYLNHMAANWHALVLNDYELVMPVPWRKKWGIRYAYDVPFIQQLGYYGDASRVPPGFPFKQMFRFVRYGNYNFNYDNSICPSSSQCCNNYILPLVESVNDDAAYFSSSFLTSVQRSKKYGLVYKNATSCEAIQMFRTEYHSRIKNITDSDYNNFLRFNEVLQKTSNSFARKVETPNGAPVAIVLLLQDSHRIYNMMNATNNIGRKMEANYFLYASLIHEFKNSGRIFDFEGSDIPGVKEFYKKFKVINQPYYRCHFNHLPPTLKWLKP